MTKFIHEKSNVDLEKDKTLFEYADKVRMRIPTSCGRVGDCHECIVESYYRRFIVSPIERRVSLQPS